MVVFCWGVGVDVGVNAGVISTSVSVEGNDRFVTTWMYCELVKGVVGTGRREGLLSGQYYFSYLHIFSFN